MSAPRTIITSDFTTREAVVDVAVISGSPVDLVKTDFIHNDTADTAYVSGQIITLDDSDFNHENLLPEEPGPPA